MVIKIRKEKFEMIKRAREAKWRTKRQKTGKKPLEKVEKKEEIEAVGTEETKEEEVKAGMKICPGCGKQINEHWTYHKCGWKE